MCFQSQSFFIRLLTLVDDFGRYEADITLLRNEAFPLRDDVRSSRVTELCSAVAKANLVTFYRTQAGKDYLQIEKWQERKRSDKSHYPEYDSTCSLLHGSRPQDSAAGRSGAQPPKPLPSPESSLSLPVREDLPPLEPDPPLVPPVDPNWHNRIGPINGWYCEQMGVKPSMDTGRDMLWLTWFKAGFEEDDFKRVLKYLRGEIDASRRNPGALKLSNMLQPDTFRDDLMLSKQTFSNATHKRTPTQGVDRNAGTANASSTNSYAGIGKV